MLATLLQLTINMGDVSGSDQHSRLMMSQASELEAADYSSIITNTTTSRLFSGYQVFRLKRVTLQTTNMELNALSPECFGWYLLAA